MTEAGGISRVISHSENHKKNNGLPVSHLAGDGGADVYARRHKQSWLYAQLNWLRAQNGG
jgi:hypothetical protein